MWIPFNLNVMNFENKGNYNLGLAIGAFLGDGYSENEIVYSFNNSTKLDITEKIMYFGIQWVCLFLRTNKKWQIIYSDWWQIC